MLHVVSFYDITFIFHNYSYYLSVLHILTLYMLNMTHEITHSMVICTIRIIARTACILYDAFVGYCFYNIQFVHTYQCVLYIITLHIDII